MHLVWLRNWRQSSICSTVTEISVLNMRYPLHAISLFAQFVLLSILSRIAVNDESMFPD